MLPVAPSGRACLTSLYLVVTGLWLIHILCTSGPTKLTSRPQVFPRFVPKAALKPRATSTSTEEFDALSVLPAHRLPSHG